MDLAVVKTRISSLNTLRLWQPRADFALPRKILLRHHREFYRRITSPTVRDYSIHYNLLTAARRLPRPSKPSPANGSGCFDTHRLFTNRSKQCELGQANRDYYQPPRTGSLTYLPPSWIPFGELMRLDKPAGTYYLFLPCLFSTLLAACHAQPSVPAILTTSALFFGGAFIMRGAGCTINDLWDRKLDPHVARTRFRPIARQAISPFIALIFAGFQCLAGLGILIQFPSPCLYYGIPSLLLVAIYPLAKRVTNYPQFVLGLTFSWGAIMGFPALGVDLVTDITAVKAVAALYMSCVSWTVLYDMIYAHMDIKDDIKVGIKSIALRHEKETKAVLSSLAVAQVGFLAVAGTVLNLGATFFLGSCGSAAATLGLMISKVRLQDPRDCWWWFQNGVWLTGGGISLGMLAEYINVSAMLSFAASDAG